VATKAKAPKKSGPDILDQQVVRTDWDKIVEQVRQNPLLYGAAAAFVLLCVVAGIFFRTGSASKARAEMTAFAKAMNSEDPALRATELGALAQGKGDSAGTALYLMGESLYEAKKYEEARQAFERLRNEFPESKHLPDAVEALGYIAENGEQYVQALGFYKEIVEKWPGSFTRRRQEMNIGRVQEKLKNLADAVKAYQTQADQFPGASVEKEAKAALDRLEKTNPELFPAPAAPAPEAAGTTGTEVPPVAEPAVEPAVEPAAVPTPEVSSENVETKPADDAAQK